MQKPKVMLWVGAASHQLFRYFLIILSLLLNKTPLIKVEHNLASGTVCGTVGEALGNHDSLLKLIF